MLHHVPSRGLQDKLLAEAYRVLKPGGLFLGSDSTTSFRFRLFHLFDTCVPVEPEGFAARLEAAGFRDVRIEQRPQYNTFKFHARKP
jgi:SAM-dependent methyltransferase